MNVCSYSNTVQAVVDVSQWLKQWGKANFDPIFWKPLGDFDETWNYLLPSKTTSHAKFDLMSQSHGCNYFTHVQLVAIPHCFCIGVQKILDNL